MVTQEIHTRGDKTTAIIGCYNIEVTNKGQDIKVFRRTMFGKVLKYKMEEEKE